ncbi:mechanosensitive ion channel family protein [Clostridium hydrogenum]|uniref:mechanosensitive ion channel family protein n=1 Tax=Clostridium hydrogenum TaxID=2855764 RepID=UPI0038B31550
MFNIIYSFKFDFETGVLKIGNASLNIYNGIFIFIKIISIIIVMYVAVRIIDKFIDKTIKKQEQFRFSLDKKRSKTIGAILKSVSKYSIYFFGIIGILTQFFGDKFLSTISVGVASIGGVAIGFGGQNLVKDVINGFFILLEDQYSVGDYITVDKDSGIVESIELRITKLRDFNGDLHIIPNSKITNVTNHSKGPKSITVDVSIAYEESIDKAIGVINSTCDKFSDKNEDVVEKPKVVGVTELTASGVTIRVKGTVKNMKQFDNETRLRKLIKEGLDKAKIEIPYNKVQFIRSE